MLKTYVDTSVFGGVFDSEFEDHSSRFFALVGVKFEIYTSDIVLDEIELAPEVVQSFFKNCTKQMLDTENEEVITLRNEYLKHKIVDPKYTNDASHVAIASVANCDLIVSWNFKHIVQLDKIKSKI